MNVDELKKNLHDVIERYRNKAEFTGEVCRDVMARDCLQVVEELEAENKKLEDYIDAYQKSEALNIEKLDKKDEHIKELEEQCTRYQAELMNSDPTLNPTISKMETTQKWIGVKDRLPDESGEYQVVYQHKNGAMVSSFDEWDDDCQDWINATDRVIVAYWAELLPPPPTTEEK